jgi:ApeA N-terminal domain 1
MFDRHEYAGLWWEPGRESGVLLGTLSVGQGRPALTVQEDFGQTLVPGTGRGRNYLLEKKPRIVGGDDASLFTLEEVQGIGRDAQGMGPRTAHYDAQVALEGKRFAKGERVVFDEISIRASDLNAWTQVSGFKTILETESVDERDRVVATEVRYEAPEDIRIPLAQDEEIFISFVCMGKGLAGGRDRVELRQESSLRWRFARPVGVYEVFERVGQMRNFLSLAVGRPVSITSVTGFQDSYTYRGTGLPRPIELHWNIPHNPEPPEDLGHPAHMLFTLADADPDPSVLLKRWIEKQGRLEPVFNLYFGALYDPDPYLEVKFLAFAQALETYDIRRREQPKRVSLAARARDVLSQHEGVSRQIVGDDIEAFVVDFRNARNYYTHYDPSLEKRAARGGALLLLTMQLQTILEMSLLGELGFPGQAIEEILDRSLRFAQVGQLRERVAGGDRGES